MLVVFVATFAFALPVLRSAEPAWRTLPLITDGKVDPNWIHVGWGGFAVEDGALRTDCAPQGLG